MSETTHDVADAMIVSETTKPAKTAAENPFTAISRLTAPEAEALMVRPRKIQVAADMTVIESADDRAFAIEDLQSIKAMLEALEVDRRSITDPLNGVVKMINDRYRPARELLERVDSELRKKVSRWDTAEERRIAEERRAAEEAKRAEQKRLADAAAAAAAQAEAATRALQQEAAAAAQAGDHHVAAAKELEAAVVEQTAVAAIAQAQVATYQQAAPPAAYKPSTAGAATRKKFKAVLKEEPGALLAMVKHIAEHPELLSLVTFSQTGANQLATALKDALVCPGLHVFEDRSLAIKSK